MVNFNEVVVMIKAIGFDFDGTLIMSEDKKGPAMAEVFKEYFGVKRGVKKAYSELIGTGLNRDGKVKFLFKKFMGRVVKKKELKLVANHFGEHYENSMNVCPLFQCVNVLKELKGQTDYLFLLSLENQREVKRIAKHCGIAHYFDDILGGPASKVDNLQKVMNKKKFKPSQVLYVGDAHSDVVVSKKLKIKVVLLGKKHTAKKLKEDLEADFVFSNLCEIPKSVFN